MLWVNELQWGNWLTNHGNRKQGNHCNQYNNPLR